MLVLGLLGAPALGKPPKIRDLADTVAANPILTKFAAMVQASDLGTFLSSRGPFTLFAPTDSAFAKLPPGMLDALLQPENKERLQDILLFHVVNGKRLTAKDLLPLKMRAFLRGQPPHLQDNATRARSLVLKAKIIHADIRCQNGIINEIDTVLMPPETALPPIAPPPAPASCSHHQCCNGQSGSLYERGSRRHECCAHYSGRAHRCAGSEAALIATQILARSFLKMALS